MSRIYNPDNAGKERNRLLKALLIAVRELAKQDVPGEESHDLAAFITLVLETIADSIDPTVAAWEKRDYWVKADRFRREWAWAGSLAKKMRKATIEEDWDGIAEVAGQLTQQLSKVRVPINPRIGRPWEGAWLALKK